MPVYIANTKFNNEFRSGQDLNYLLGCIGEKIIVETTFYYENIIFALEDNNIVCHPNAADIGTFTSPGELIWLQDMPNGFAEYEVGDIINIQGSAAGNNNGGGGFTITEKISGNLIRCGGATFTYEVLPYGAGAYLSNITPYKGCRYNYNILDAGSNYNSLIDGELQQLKTDSADSASAVPMAFNGISSYQIGSATIYRTAFSSERQTFKIVHTTFITPFFLAAQFNNLLSGIKPNYFNAGSCLKYIYKLQLCRVLNNPLFSQALSVNNAANTGWFNENFNGGATNYLISNYSLKRLPALVALTALEFTNEIQLTFTIKNSSNPFSSGNTKFVLNFCYLPENESLYQNNGRNQAQNFVFDRCLNTLGSAAANGENFGTGMQVIKTFEIDYVSALEVSVTATIEIGSTAKSIMTEGDFSRYMFWITTENHALSAASSDKVALLLEVNEIIEQTVESDLITNSTLFIKHPYLTKADGEPSTEVFPTDDVVARSDFSIDFTNRESDGIKIRKINPQLILQKTGSPNIILDDFVIDVSAYPTVASLFQNINFHQDRVFNIPDEIRKYIEIKNNFSDDSGMVHNWYLNFPFMVRWEYWIALLGLASPPTGIFDTTKPLNGINHFWHRLTTVSGWNLRYSLKFIYEQKGATATQIFTNSIGSHDFNSNPEWINESIKSYSQASPVVITSGPLVIGTVYTITNYEAGDDFTNVGGTNVTGDVFTATGTTPTVYSNGSTLSGVVNTELTSGGNKFLQGYEKTKIVASFEWAAGSPPALEDVVMVFWIARFEGSGIVEVRRISSLYVLDSGSWFLSIDGSDKIQLDKVGSVYTGTCLINKSLLPPASKYTIYARLYHLPTLSVPDKQFEDGDLFYFEDGSPYSFEQ